MAQAYVQAWTMLGAPHEANARVLSSAEFSGNATAELTFLRLKFGKLRKHHDYEQLSEESRCAN